MTDMVARPSTAARDTSFDALKGVLVILMVVYHAMSIASTAGAEAFRYIRFISGSFIFISGFVVVRFMWDRFESAPRETTLRLVLRGLKVLLIFTVLNLAIHASGFGNADKQQLGVTGFARNAETIFLSGDGRQSSFVILLPIAYLLMLSPLFIAAARRSQVLAGGAGILAALALGSGLFALSPIGEFMVVGLCGLCLGPPAIAERVLPMRAPTANVTIIGLTMAIWLGGRHGSPLSLYCAGVALVLKFLLDAVRLPSPMSSWFGQVVRLGQYSLFAYIVQIVLIQLLFRALGGERDEHGYVTAALIVAVALGCALLCNGLERLRARFVSIDRTYRWVFA